MNDDPEKTKTVLMVSAMGFIVFLIAQTLFRALCYFVTGHWT